MIDIGEIFNRELVRELLMEKNPDITPDVVDRIWFFCDGNPWNAPVLYEIMEFNDE
jgi:hypothetical protein